MKKLFVFLTLVSIYGIHEARATELKAQAGTWEVVVETQTFAAGSFSSTIAGTSVKTEPTTATIDIPIGYFVTDAVEIIAEVGYKSTTAKTSVGATPTTTTTTTTSYGVGALYNFHPGGVVPFLGGLIGGINSESKDSSKTTFTATHLDLGGGFRVPVTDRVAVRLAGSYGAVLSGNLDLGGGLSGSLAGGVFGLDLGVSLLF